MVRRLGALFSSRRRRRFGAVLALLACVAVLAGVVLRASPPSKRFDSSHGDASGTATVQRRDLVETDTESGTIGYADPQTVYNRSSGTITWLPAVGQMIKPGQTLFRIDGEPVTLMDGSAPAYRDLNASDAPGADIEQLNRNLVRLGFDPDGIVIDNQWQPATTAGVELFQASLGEDETGSLSLGQVVFLPGGQVISALDGTVGSTGAGGGGSTTGGGSSQNASTSPAGGDPEFVSVEPTASQHGTAPVEASRSAGAAGSCQSTADASTRTTTTTTTTSTTTAPCATSTSSIEAPKHRSSAALRASDGSGELSTLTALLKAEAAQLKAATAALKAAKRSSSSRSSSAGKSSSSKSARPGSGGGAAATAILQTSSTQLIVTVDLSASSQSEAKLGAPVTVQLPSGKTVDGTIIAVSPVAETSPSSGSGNSSGAGGSANGGTGASSTVPVTIKLKGHHRGAGMNQASVSVNFTQAEAKHVLSVPVTALIATAGGGYAVQEANAPHAQVPVTTDLFAAGDVQISGPGIHPGLRVTNSQG